MEVVPESWRQPDGLAPLPDRETVLARGTPEVRAGEEVGDPGMPATLDTPDPGASPWRQLTASRDYDRLRRALMMLPEDRRELIVLARYDGMKHDQIAALLGIGVGAVKVRIHRALRELRQRFLQMPDAHAPCDVKSSRDTLQII